jgi:hypothetical protein
MDHPTDLITRIRTELVKRVPSLTEECNKKSRYFGYWVGKDKDRLYIFARKKALRICLCIDRSFETAIRKAGFEIHHHGNFRGQAGWLTGWQVPQSTRNRSLNNSMMSLVRIFNIDFCQILLYNQCSMFYTSH